MKILTFSNQNQGHRLGLLVDGNIYDVNKNYSNLPDNMLEFLNSGEKGMDDMRNLERFILEGKIESSTLQFDEKNIASPITNPTSCRDGYAFRQHVAAARRNRGVPMIPEFDEYPIFYFTNHNAIQGPGDIWCMPDHFQKLDFELEVAVVLGKKGRNIKAENADEYIAGYMIMNDMSARTLQMEEMLLNLGPAKGKDFSTVIGPYLVTPDELEKFKVPAKNNHVGNNYALDMTCRVNGIEVSKGNMADMDWTFAEIIERCAYGVDVLPGDVIGSGTVGTGCFLELNGTGLLNNKDFQPQWLQANDVVEMEITGLGLLSNTIRAVETDFSILAKKKKALGA
jgi:fumarylacetoacetate (FAA) hydrolase